MLNKIKVEAVSRPLVVDVRYDISKKMAERLATTLGRYISDNYTVVTMNITEVPRDVRRKLFKLCTKEGVHSYCFLLPLQSGYKGRSRSNGIYWQIPDQYFPLTVENIGEVLNEFAPELAAAKKEAAANESKERAKVRAYSRAHKNKESEKKKWIARLGSEHLKEAFGAGYDCQRQYIQERASREFPGWELDFDSTFRVEGQGQEQRLLVRGLQADCEVKYVQGYRLIRWAKTLEKLESVVGEGEAEGVQISVDSRHALWNTRSCPSPRALSLAKKVGGVVVWLTQHPDYETDDEEEAVVLVLDGEHVAVLYFQDAVADRGMPRVTYHLEE